MVSNRVYEQLESMISVLSQFDGRAILIIHGNMKEINKRYFTDMDFFSAIGQIAIDNPTVSIYFVPNELAVANILASMYYKTYQPDQPTYNWVRKTKDPRFDVLRACRFSTRQIKELNKHYSLQEVFNLPDKELKNITYIGPATAKKFIILRKKKG